MSEKLPTDRHLLIEASAGTGKTYAIVELYFRLLTEKKLSVPEILVVTFTEKATGELKERIRARLNTALLSGGFPSDPAANETAKHLEKALQDFANAPIYTIHGFCNSLLSEYAFEAGEPFQTEMANDSAIAEKLLPELFAKETETWQKELEELIAKEEGLAEKEARVRAERILYQLLEKSGLFKKDLDGGIPWFSTIQEACEKLSSHLRAELWPDVQDDFQFLRLKRQACTIKKKIIKELKSLLGPENIARQKFSNMKLRKSKTKTAFEQLLHEVYTSQSLATNEMHFAGVITDLEKPVVFDKPTEKQETEITKHFPELFRAIEISDCYYKNYIDPIPQQFQSILTKKLEQEIEAYKEKHGLLSYDDMLKKVERACREPEFVSRVQSRFRYAIVDEFQDTDTIQWSIFRRLFLDGTSGADFPKTAAGQKQGTLKNDRHGRHLILVGDPKQAIYSFRGADIYAYLEAKSVLEKIQESQPNAAQIQNLDTNYRSTPELLEPLNLLFAEGTNKGNWFVLPKIGKSSLPYPHIKAAKNGRKRSLSAGDLKASLGTGRAHLNILHFGPLGSPSQVAVELIRSRYYRFIAREIQSLVGRLHFTGAESANNNDDDSKEHRLLRYKDVAVLVRTVREAGIVQRYLDKAGVPNFRYKEQGLYESREALELYLLLLAQKKPSDAKAVRAFLATSLGRSLIAREGWDLELALAKLQSHLEKWERHLERLDFVRYFEEVFWDTGLLDPLQEAPATSGSSGEAEKGDAISLDSSQRRLNFFQIREHLEEAALHGKKSIDALLRILAERKTQVPEELSLLKSNPEEDKVQILTFHVSKGLEFPVVFIAGGFTSSNKQDKFHTFHEDAKQDADRNLKEDGKSKNGDANSDSPSKETPPKRDGTDNFGPQRLIIDLTKKKNTDKYEQEKQEEEQRLMYVALTRAALMLYVPYYPQKTKNGSIAKNSGPLSKVVAPAIENAFPQIFSQQTQDSQTKPKDKPKGNTKSADKNIKTSASQSKGETSSPSAKNAVPERFSPEIRKDLSESHTAFLQIGAFGQVEAVNTEEAKEPRQALPATKASGQKTSTPPSPGYVRTTLPDTQGRYTPLDSFSGLKRRLDRYSSALLSLEENNLNFSAHPGPKQAAGLSNTPQGRPEFLDVPQDRIDEGEALSRIFPKDMAEPTTQEALLSDPNNTNTGQKKAPHKEAPNLEQLGGMAFGTLLHEILEKIDYADIGKAEREIQKKVEEFLKWKASRNPASVNQASKEISKQIVKEITKELSSLLEGVLCCPIPLPNNLLSNGAANPPEEKEQGRENNRKNKKNKQRKESKKEQKSSQHASVEIEGNAPLFEYAAKAKEAETPFLLSQIPKKDRRHEVEFVFHKKELKDLLSALDTKASPAELGLSERAGLYLRGSIDIVFRIGNRYFLADWKSNYSPSGYGRDSLEKIMQEHGYNLQRRIYCIALHRWLKFALPDYDFEQHFGGAYYFFLRGMKKKGIANEGILFYRPKSAEIAEPSSS